MNKLFLSCLKATELLEKKLHFSLSIQERYQLRVHKAMCDACRRYEKQTVFIENNLKHQNTHLKYQNTIEGSTLDVEALKKQINAKLDSGS